MDLREKRIAILTRWRYGLWVNFHAALPGALADLEAADEEARRGDSHVPQPEPPAAPEPQEPARPQPRSRSRKAGA